MKAAQDTVRRKRISICTDIRLELSFLGLISVQGLVDAVAVHVVVRPRGIVDRGPGGLSLRVERARGSIILVRVDGDSRVALGLQVRAPGLVGLEPVAASSSVVPVNSN